MIIGLHLVPKLDSNSVQLCNLRLGKLQGHDHNFTSDFQVALTYKQDKNTLFYYPWPKYLLVYNGKFVGYHGKLVEHLTCPHALRHAVQNQHRWEWKSCLGFGFHLNLQLSTASFIWTATIASKTRLIFTSVRRISACWSRTISGPQMNSRGPYGIYSPRQQSFISFKQTDGRLEE